MNELVERAQQGIAQKGTLVKWGGGIAALAAFSFVGWFAVSGAASLIVLGVLFLVVNIAQQAMPLVQMKMQNRLLAAIKAEAANNPIETAQAVYHQRQLQLEQSIGADRDYIAEVNKLKARYADYFKKFPEDSKDESDAEIAMHDAAIVARNQVYADNVAAQEELSKLIQKLQLRYESALQSLKASKAGNINIGDVYAKLKLATAYDEVMGKSAEAAAALQIAQRTSMASRPVQLAAPAQPVLIGPFAATPVSQTDTAILVDRSKT